MLELHWRPEHIAHIERDYPAVLDGLRSGLYIRRLAPSLDHEIDLTGVKGQRRLELMDAKQTQAFIRTTLRFEGDDDA